jgi:hypothetical protein
VEIACWPVHAASISPMGCNVTARPGRRRLAPKNNLWGGISHPSQGTIRSDDTSINSEKLSAHLVAPALRVEIAARRRINSPLPLLHEVSSYKTFPSLCYPTRP